jgi:cell division protein FtsW (lipid II flippase)
MSSEEKSAWIMAFVAVGAYAVYVVLVATRGAADYAPIMLWTIGASIVAGIVLRIVAAIVSPKDADKKDSRDREIYRHGEYIGQSFLVVGGVAALLLALLRVDYFWIANVIYLGFVLSAILASVAKVMAYRKGFVNW